VAEGFALAIAHFGATAFWGKRRWSSLVAIQQLNAQIIIEPSASFEPELASINVAALSGGDY